jgi:hypothetical protein
MSSVGVGASENVAGVKYHGNMPWYFNELNGKTKCK